MKNRIRIIVIISGILLFLATGIHSFAQPDPPPPPEQHGLNGNAAPTGAPVGNGIGIFFLSGFIYATMKMGQKMPLKHKDTKNHKQE
jgi:hypothetical protein